MRRAITTTITVLAATAAALLPAQAVDYGSGPTAAPSSTAVISTTAYTAVSDVLVEHQDVTGATWTYRKDRPPF